MTTWDDTHRSDGLVIIRGFEGIWYIITRDERRIVDRCPCCDRALDTKHTAQTVADHLVPCA